VYESKDRRFERSARARAAQRPDVLIAKETKIKQKNNKTEKRGKTEEEESERRIHSPKNGKQQL
jgi:hypothetical protein